MNCLYTFFLCRLRSIATHRDHFVRRPSVCLSVRPSVCLSIRPSVCPSVTLSKAMFCRRHMHSSQCCHYFLTSSFLYSFRSIHLSLSFFTSTIICFFSVQMSSTIFRLFFLSLISASCITQQHHSQGENDPLSFLSLLHQHQVIQRPVSLLCVSYTSTIILVFRETRYICMPNEMWNSCIFLGFIHLKNFKFNEIMQSLRKFCNSVLFHNYQIQVIIIIWYKW